MQYVSSIQKGFSVYGQQATRFIVFRKQLCPCIAITFFFNYRKDRQYVCKKGKDGRQEKEVSACSYSRDVYILPCGQRMLTLRAISYVDANATHPRTWESSGQQLVGQAAKTLPQTAGQEPGRERKDEVRCSP